MSTLNAAKKKLHKYYRSLKKEINEGAIDGIIAAPDAQNVLHWNAVIFGPKGTQWEDGVFELEMEFTDEFPQYPPTVKFITPVYHPNVYKNGNICLDILQKKWSSAYDIAAILNSIRSLFDDPNPQSPANGEAARDFQSNRITYDRKVAECVRESIKLWKEKHPEQS